MPRSAPSSDAVLQYQGHPIPVRIYRERRNGVRFSIGKRYAILRLPSYVGQPRAQQLWQDFEAWVTQQFDHNEALRQRFFGRSYRDGDTFTLLDRTFRLAIRHTDQKSSTIVLRAPDTLHLQLAHGLNAEQQRRTIQTLLSRAMGRIFKPYIESRVDYFNDRYYHESINEIRLKRNQSNWGSCSSGRNLNFSTRLLFAPPEVIDYVIVHELAHLKEMNHSPAFWRIVASVMPDYPRHEQWLKTQGHTCAF